MAGLLPGICNSQNMDRNGLPLLGSQLSIYQGGTLNLAACFQDIQLTIPQQNPMTSDQNGRLPLFFVADGTYRARLVDSTGVLVYDFLLFPSIGASTSGGGGSGSAVDPTSIFQTGDPIWLPLSGGRTGWVRMNGNTIGSPTSGASERANNDVQPLFLYLWNNYADNMCPVIGGRGATAAADWASNKQITLIDMRGLAPFGLDGMGALRANIIADSHVAGPSGAIADTPGAFGGESDHVLGVTELTPHTHPLVDPGHVHTINITDPGHAHGITDPTHNHTLSNPTHTHGITDPAHNHLVSDFGHAHQLQGFSGSFTGGGNEAPLLTTQPVNTNSLIFTLNQTTGITINNNTTGISVNAAATTVSSTASATGITVNSGTTGITAASVSKVTGMSMTNTGGGLAHNNMPPFRLGTWYQKL